MSFMKLFVTVILQIIARFDAIYAFAAAPVCSCILGKDITYETTRSTENIAPIDQKRSVFAGFRARNRIQSLIPSELIARCVI